MTSASRRALRVIEPGMLSTVQDVGRRGAGWMGVSPCGAADWFSARAANRLVGNLDACALIETTLTGATFELAVDAPVAVTGAEASLAVGSRVCEVGRAYAAKAGDRVMIGAARLGLRSYLAVAGGVVVPALFQSASTDVTSGFGGRVLVRGDELDLGLASGDGAGDGSVIGAAPRHLLPSGVAVLRAMVGLDDRLGADLFKRSFSVSSRSSRQALILDGGGPAWGGPTGVVSFGVVAGCVQIAGDGSPMVLMVEHQTTGGYAIAACVIYADMPVAGQLPPGAPVRFELVGPEAADVALAERKRALQAYTHRHDGSADVACPTASHLAQGFFEGSEP